jgi:hypothetical protein
MDASQLLKVTNLTKQSLKYITDPALRSQLEQELVRLQLEYNKALSEQTILTLQTKSKDKKKTVSNEPHVSDIIYWKRWVNGTVNQNTEKIRPSSHFSVCTFFGVITNLSNTVQVLTGFSPLSHHRALQA